MKYLSFFLLLLFLSSCCSDDDEDEKEDPPINQDVNLQLDLYKPNNNSNNNISQSIYPNSNNNNRENDVVDKIESPELMTVKAHVLPRKSYQIVEGAKPVPTNFTIMENGDYKESLPEIEISKKDLEKGEVPLKVELPDKDNDYVVKLDVAPKQDKEVKPFLSTLASLRVKDASTVAIANASSTVATQFLSPDGDTYVNPNTIEDYNQIVGDLEGVRNELQSQMMTSQVKDLHQVQQATTHFLKNRLVTNTVLQNKVAHKVGNIEKKMKVEALQEAKQMGKALTHDSLVDNVNDKLSVGIVTSLSTMIKEVEVEQSTMGPVTKMMLLPGNQKLMNEFDQIKTVTEEVKTLSTSLASIVTTANADKLSKKCKAPEENFDGVCAVKITCEANEVYNSINNSCFNPQPLPFLFIKTPISNVIVHSKVKLHGLCESSYPIEVSGDVSSERSIDCTAGKFETPVLLAKEEGIKKVVLTQSDDSDHSVELTRNVVRDDAQLISAITSPLEYSHLENSFSIEGFCDPKGSEVRIEGPFDQSILPFKCEETFSNKVTFTNKEGEYIFYVHQQDSSGNYSVADHTLLVDTNPPIIDETTLSASNLSPSGVTISWTAATDAVDPLPLAYQIYMSENSLTNEISQWENHSTPLTSWSTNMTNYDVTSVTGGMRYYFNVIVKDSLGHKSLYSSVEVDIPISPDTTPPTVGGSGLLTFTPIDNESVTVSWSKATDDRTADEHLTYQVHISSTTTLDDVNDLSVSTKAHDFTADINSYTVSTIDLTKNYFITVSVKDEAGNIAVYDGKRFYPVLLRAGWEHICVRLMNGKIKCWGGNNGGQLGRGNTDAIGDEENEMGNDLPYIDLGSGRTVKKLSTEDKTICAILDNDKVKCWGDNTYGQLGLGDVNHRGDEADEMGDNLPYVSLGTNRTAKDIFTGRRVVCALLDNDSLKCWGNNEYGQLGQGDTTNRGDDADEMGDNLPTVNLGSNRTVKHVTHNSLNLCAILDNDLLKCWGDAQYGQLGAEDTVVRGDNADEMGDDLPYVDLGAGKTVLAVTSGSTNHCVILNDRSVKCWGYNLSGRLGTAATENLGDNADEMGDDLPNVQMGTGRTATFISTAPNSTHVILDNGTVKGWGRNFSSRLGTSDGVHYGMDLALMGDNLPTINFGSGRTVIQFANGSNFGCGLLDNFQLKCFGKNSLGESGVGDIVDRGSTPESMGDNLPYVDINLSVY